MVDFFSSIDAPLLKEGSVRKLHDAGYDSIESVIMMEEPELVDIIGSNGTKIFNGLHAVLDNIPLYKIIGAHSMERGIGVRRMKMLQEALGRDDLYKCNDEAVIADQDGFDAITGAAVIRALDKFRDFMHEINGYITIAEERDTSDGVLAGKKVVFTGFRDKTLEVRVENEGGSMQSSVSGKTNIVVAANITSNSGKVKKARDLGVTIMGLQDFKEMLDG